MAPRPIINPAAPVIFRISTRVFGGINVAVGQHGERQFSHGSRDQVVVHFVSVHFGTVRPCTVSKIKGMPGKDRQQLVETPAKSNPTRF